MQDSLLQYFGESEIAFDHFVIKTPSVQVFKDGKPCKLEPQVLTFLLLLIRHKDHIVTREEIVSEVWLGKKASDDAIRALVKKLRIALGDNARAPKFIKTVPLQGYLFIMPVQIDFYQPDWWRKKAVIYGASIVVIILITLLIQAQFGSFQRKVEQVKREVLVSKITEMKGSEVSPYLSKNGRLLFSHRGLNDASLQLYVKDVNSVAQKRLTWSKADFVDGIFSPDASQAIVKKRENDKESLLIFNFDEVFNLIKVEPIELDEALASKNINAMSYSANSQDLYLHVNNTSSNQSEVGLIRYNIRSKGSITLALPISPGAIVLDAKESDDGKFLAVLARGDNFAEIHVQNMITKEVKLTKRMPHTSNSFVWAPDNESITFATDTGNLLNLNLAKQRFYRWTGLPLAVSKVVSQCGEYCFVVKEQEANLTNVIERPLSFNTNAFVSTTQFPLSSGDNFPTYFAEGAGIYFLSLAKNTLAIKRYMDGNDGGDVESMYELPQTSGIKTFVLSPDGKNFAGELGGRIFIYDVGLSTLSFLTSGSHTNTNPVWSLQSDVLFYQQSLNNVSTIYAHDIVSGVVSVKASGFRFIKPLAKNQWLLVDDKLHAYFYEHQEAQQQSATDALIMSPDILAAATKITELDTIASNAFDVQNDKLFFISGSADTRFFNQFTLQTKQLESAQLTGQSVLPQIDIHPQMQKMLIVESSLSQSNLLRVDGLSLAPRKVNQVVTETP